MRSPLHRRHGHLQRGQSLSLTALLVLVLTLAVMLTFSIGTRVREKIKLQALADASAYSLAVAEARAFNYYAWSNRAIVAHYVAMLSVSSYDSYLSFYEDLLSRVGANYRGIKDALHTQCTQRPACPCSVTACTAERNVDKIIQLYFTSDPGPMGQGGWAPAGKFLGAEAFQSEFEAKRSPSRFSDPKLAFCCDLLAGIKDHYGNRVPAIRFQQLDMETQLLWYMSGTAQQRPFVPQLETFALGEDVTDPTTTNSIHQKSSTFGGTDTPLANRYGMPDQLAALVDPTVQSPERDENLQSANPLNTPLGQSYTYDVPQPGTASGLTFGYYVNAVANDPHPHDDYDEILLASRIGDHNGSPLQQTWITQRGFIPNVAHWNHFLNQANALAAGQGTGTNVTETGNAQAVSQTEGGAGNPGDGMLYKVYSPSSPYAPFSSKTPLDNYDIPSDPYVNARNHVSRSYDADNNWVSRSGQALATQVHSFSGFGNSFALASEDHGNVDTWYDIHCASGACRQIDGHFVSSHPVRVGRDNIYGDPGQTQATTPEQHGMHTWSGIPYHEGGHSFTGAANFSNFVPNVDEFCDNPQTCGLYQGHMQFQYSTDPNLLFNQPRTLSMLYKPSHPSAMQPWDFDFQVGLMGLLGFTTWHSQGDAQSTSSGTNQPMLGAIAAGLAYYHRPEGGGHDDWKEAPNLWNPFWRAKLHPIKESDGSQVLANDLISDDGQVVKGIIGAGHHPFNY
jgi:hypothetical protein